VTIKSRIVTVKGPRGSVSKDFSHIGVELQILKQASKKRTGNYIRFRMWFGAYKQACAVRTV
jgi:large subunit ribosomal protein L9e